MWGPEDIQNLKAAANKFDREAAAPIVSRLAGQVRDGSAKPDGPQQSSALKPLKAARWFGLLQTLGGVLRSSGQATHTARRLYAQALVDLKLLDEALVVLEELLDDPACPPDEHGEAGGLVGRVYKQVYVDQYATLGPARRSTLTSSIGAYFAVYAKDRKAFTWQGINAVAMMLRGRRDQVPVVEPAAPGTVADEILRATANARDHWDLCTAAEALIALDRWSEAKTFIEAYVKHADLDSFSAASTLRQLKEVWQLKEGGIGGELITMLQPAVLGGSGDPNKPATLRVGAGISLAAGELNTASTCSAAESSTLERVFGKHGPRSFEWYRQGIDRARSVAKIETQHGEGFGTGFLVKGSALFPRLLGSEENLLVTNSHVISNDDPEALRPTNAVVRWEAVDTARRLGVAEILFESGRDALDVTICRLDAVPTGVDSVPIAPPVEPTYVVGRERRLYIIGHPNGAKLSVSLDDNLQVGWLAPKLHYRTPTNPGSSGSPVFDDAWRLLAVHHAGSDTMPRLDGQPGTYQANEGIWIHAVIDAIAKQQGSGVTVEAASPAVRPAFRRKVFISYAHTDAEWLERLVVQLMPLERSANLEVWNDRKIVVGSNWSIEIERQLDTAAIAIILVSPNFLASQFITNTELPKLLEASAKRGLTVIPIAVRSSNYTLVPEIAAIQFANDPQRPLALLTDAERDAALTVIVDRIAGVLSLSSMSNQLRAMDAVAFKESGLGGKKAAEAGVAALGARGEQVNNQVVLQTSGGGQVVVASLQTIQSLGAADRQLVDTFDITIQDLFERWNELYPKRVARDLAVRERARGELVRLRGDLCRELNLLLDFYGRLGAPLQDHYSSIRYICAESFTI